MLVSLHGDDPLPARLVEAQIPVVVVGRPLHATGISYVDVDNRGGARTAVADLIAGGRRVIAAIGGPGRHGRGQDRRAGYRDALTDAGIGLDPTPRVANADFTHEGGIAAMRRLLEARPDIDAVFAASDLMAAGALSVLDAAGREFPRTSRSSATTTRRSRRWPVRPSPASASRSRRWARKWPACCSSSSTPPTVRPAG